MARRLKSSDQFDLFVPYMTDLPLRDQRETMERPFFALAKRKRLKLIDYVSPDGMVWVKVQPHQDFGMATIYDADILIWAASQITEYLRRRGRNEPPGPTLRFQPYDLLRAIRRNTGGKDYQELRQALDRLRTTSIKTNIRGKGKKKEASFQWLDSWTDHVDETSGQSLGMTLTLSNWMYEGLLLEGGVLSIHPEYFELTGAIERWLYRIARKHAGNQTQGSTITVTTLYEKSGSEDVKKKFKAALKKIAATDRLPEYHLDWVEKTESGDSAVHMVRREFLAPDHPGYGFPSRKDRRRPALAKPSGR
ncbi:MAG: replication initiator protein A [Rhodospirillales bacterium]|nr:replication initiator protein A [Rhodospirillales bacterium]